MLLVSPITLKSSVDSANRSRCASTNGATVGGVSHETMVRRSGDGAARPPPKPTSHKCLAELLRIGLMLLCLGLAICAGNGEAPLYDYHKLGLLWPYMLWVGTYVAALLIALSGPRGRRWPTKMDGAYWDAPAGIQSNINRDLAGFLGFLFASLWVGQAPEHLFSREAEMSIRLALLACASGFLCLRWLAPRVRKP
jgi:hypothetical protein